MVKEVRVCDSIQRKEIVMTDWVEIILQTSTKIRSSTGEKPIGFKINYIFSNMHQSGK